MSYVVQALASAALVLGVVCGVVGRRLLRLLRGTDADHLAAKEIEPPIVRVPRGSPRPAYATSRPVAARARPRSERFPGWRGDLLVASSLALFVAVVLPVQTYLANASLFVFTPGRLAWETALLFGALTLALALVLRICGTFLGPLPRALAVALLACVFLESGLLSRGLPEVNGGLQRELAVASRAWWDGAVWLAALVGALVFAARARRIWVWLALAFVPLALSFLLDVRREVAPARAPSEEGASRGGFAWQYDILANFRYSPTRNVLVFVLDSMPGNLAYAAVAADPVRRAQFQGFTAYTNNIAMHDCTKFGLPALVTGHYFEPGVTSAADFPMTLFAADSFMRPYAAAGSAVYFAPDLLPYGYTNRPLARRMPVQGRQKHDWSVFLLRTRDVPYLSLLDTVVFRLVPYVFKAPFLYSKIRHDPMIGRDTSAFWYEHVMFPLLAEAPLSDAAQTLGLFHSRGAHPPLVFDPSGRPYETAQLRANMIDELVSTPLAHLGRLLDALRARGLLDTSFIVVTTDHGIDLAPCARGHHPSESAVLWVKPENARAPFAAAALPTGHARIAPLLKAAAEGPLAPEAIARLLRSDARLFRFQCDGGFGASVVGPDGAMREVRP